MHVGHRAGNAVQPRDREQQTDHHSHQDRERDQTPAQASAGIDASISNSGNSVRRER
jgi:hypothetical protein